MKEELIDEFLKEIETLLYLENPVNDKTIAEKVIKILEKEYDI